MNENLITYAAFLTSTQDSPFETHRDHQILFVTAGEVALQLPQKTLHIKKGDLVFLSKYENYHTRIIHEPYKRYMLSVSAERVGQYIDDAMLLSMLCNHPAEFNHCVRVRDISCFLGIWGGILSEYNNGFQKPYTKEMQTILVKELLIRAYRTQNPSAPFMTHSGMRDQVLSVQAYLDKHFHSDIRINMLCQDLHINPSHFSRVFKTYVGMSPKQYLTVVRMNNVRHELATTNRSITAIAMGSGFADINNFIRTFRNTYGMTPTQFRASLTEEK